MKNLKQTVKAVFAFGLLSLLLISCNSKEAVPSNYYNEPANIIPIQQAKEMYDEYTISKVPLLSNIDPKNGREYNPTRYIEYDIEDLKHYIAYVENESAKANVEVLSLRIYLAAYPNAKKFKSGGVISKQNQETIFITPTAMNGDEEMAYFTRSDKVGGKRYPVFTKGLGDELMRIKGFGNRKFDKASLLLFTTQKDTTDDRSMTMNRGFVVPPPKKDDDFNN